MKSKCVDAGREGRPCELAEYGACPVCAKLAGGTCDDCSFPGSCIYSLYVQNGRKQVAGRRERLMQVETVKTYSEDFKVLVIKAEKGFLPEGADCRRLCFRQSRRGRADGMICLYLF